MATRSGNMSGATHDLYDTPVYTCVCMHMMRDEESSESMVTEYQMQLSLTTETG